MHQRDYLKDQIDQMAKTLAHILANFLGLKSQGDVHQGISVTSEQFTELLNWDIHQLLEFDEIQLEGFITENHLTDEHINQLGQYLYEVGIANIESNKKDGMQYLLTCLRLFRTSEKIHQSSSFHRLSLIQNIEAIINRS